MVEAAFCKVDEDVDDVGDDDDDDDDDDDKVDLCLPEILEMFFLKFH